MTLTSFPLSNFNFAFADLVSLEVACLLLHSFATVLEGELLRGGTDQLHHRGFRPSALPRI